MKNNSVGTALVLLFGAIFLVLTAFLVVNVLNRMPEIKAALGDEPTQTEAPSETLPTDATEKTLPTASEPTETEPPSAMQQAREAAADGTLQEKLESGDIDVWALFENAVVLGDARAVDFARYGYLDESRVLASEGDTIRNISDHINELAALQPEYVFLCYGLNDVTSGFWTTPLEYASELIELITQINITVPSAKVIVSAILPVTEDAQAENEQYENILQYSATVESTAVEFGLVFANSDVLLREHDEYYALDGIRLTTDFYPIWAADLMTAALS